MKTQEITQYRSLVLFLFLDRIMPLFETIPIDTDEVRRLCHEHWGVHLGDCLKVSQNHTFVAKNDAQERFIVRVTPDPSNTRFNSIQLEIAVLDFLHANELPACRAIPSTLASTAIVRNGDLIICLFTFASGESLNYTEWTWMTKRDIVHGLGRWLARLHQLTRRFVQERPDLAVYARHWTTLHEGVLAEVPVDERDRKTESDSSHFGLIHGDVNASNYYWDSSIGLPFMFDWDQLQRSWFLYDLSAPIWGVMMLEKAGSPFDRSPVPEANSERYTNWLIEGYESDGDRTLVDRSALDRMVMIRRELYRRFCRKALLELSADHPMAQFCKHVAEFFDKEESMNSIGSKV